MAMEYLGSKVLDAALGSLLQRLLDEMDLPFLKSVGHLFGVEREANKLSSALCRVRSHLSDTQRLWPSEIKDVLYDAEDILDELASMELRSKLETPIDTRKRKLLAFPQVRNPLSKFASNIDLGSRIREIRERLEEIESNRPGDSESYGSEYRRLQRCRKRLRTTSHYADESILVGREADRQKVVCLLLDNSSTRKDIEVIPICGMAGLGKTALAQLVFKDKRVTDRFEVKAWVHVSEDFDLTRLTKEILESVTRRSCDPVTRRSCDLTHLDTIQLLVKEALEVKRFLLVLDDVWNDNCNDWDVLRAPLMNGARGSRILITTRSRKVSSNMGTIPTHSLLCLSYGDCWSLFKQQAFADGNPDAHPDLKKIGEQIVKKCKGLPLSVKTLGGLLRSKRHVEQWEAILESKMWDLQEGINDILPALILSYDHLPAYLKPCFAYCCVFKKGSKVQGDLLVLMWMAQGFVQSKGSNQVEDIGRDYLDDLVSRSLLDYDDACSEYTMHDLTHDLARSVLGAEFLDSRGGTSCGDVDNARHMSYHLSGTESFKFEDFHCSKSLRTLRLYGSATCFKEIPDGFFRSLRHIRVLDLEGTGITMLPESIGSLIQLRHLDLSRTPIGRLPKSTASLYNLQTLMVKSCCKLVELPSDLSNLVNLRHLSILGCPASTPARIGRLKSLQTLEVFNVGKENECRINELKNLIHLRGLLCILNLENVVNVEEAKGAELEKRHKIRKLHLQWKSNDVELRQEGIEEEVLKVLQPHTNLEELGIEGFCGFKFPTWLGNDSFSKLVSVDLFRCKCRHLPSFGRLPSLKHLSLRELYGLRKMGNEFKGCTSLKMLGFWSIPDLEEWSCKEGDISHVNKITISNCSKLRGLPLFPLTLESATIEHCERLATLSRPRVSTIRELTLSGCDQRVLSSLQYLTSLCYLSIYKFPNLTSLPNGLLQPLIALEKLHISFCGELMFLSEEVGLQHLTSLKSLEISFCPRLGSLDGLQDLTSLVGLRLEDCPKIHSLPEELPTTLQSLIIDGCPVLTEKCLNGGEYWWKLSHIPKKIIDDRFIS